jgi:acyl-CoA synthetase (AMP-forming)/AMP-acid ligase II
VRSRHHAARSASSGAAPAWGTTTAWTRSPQVASGCSVGDMARRDADGYIHLVDRKSNMIISGGENIYFQ